MELDSLQQRLHAQFASLKGLRATSHYPVYALEHGLDISEMDEAIRALSDKHNLDDTLWLVWIAVAAEIGYGFEGGEYWDSFAERVRGWLTFGNRYRVRSWFERFEGEYAGFRPSGAWAEHRRIISWPIMHAVLPADLQPTFTHVMHRMRFELLDEENTNALAKRFRSLAANENTRFQKLADQPGLVSHLLRALSAEESAVTADILSPPLFRRLVEDIRRTPSARAWLADTRKTVTQIRGAARGVHRAGGTRAAPATSLSADRPTLELRRTGRNSWDAFIDLPSLDPLARASDEARSVLRSTRCSLPNGAGTWLPPGWLLEGPHTKPIRTWPETGKPIVKLAKTAPALEAYMAAHYSLSPGPTWLCRIAPDGRALELLGRQVRPGGSYLLLHQQDLPPLAELPADTVAVNCENICVHQISVPTQLSQRVIDDIKLLGLSLVQTVRLWPVGTNAREWDGEGNAEWLTTEAMTLAIQGDFPLVAYSVALDDEPPVRVAAPSGGKPSFICLPALAAGEHKLRVTPIPPAGQSFARDLDGTLNIRVRTPQPWNAGANHRTGLSVYVDPVDGDLDDLARSRLALHILGPSGRKAEVRISVQGETDPNADHQIALPNVIRDWTPYLTQNIEDALLSARRADVLISAGELGEVRLAFEHEPQPLAWRVKRDTSETTIRLIDEAGIEGNLKTSFYSFENPATSTALDAEACKTGLRVCQSGGLYRAVGGGYDEAAVVSTPFTGSYAGFGALGVQPGIPAQLSKRANVEQLLHLMFTWSKAPARDFFASSNKVRVTTVLDRALLGVLCGPWWTRAEEMFVANGSDAAALETFTRNWRSSLDEKGVIALIRKRQRELAPLTAYERVEWLAEPLKRRGICTDPDLVDTAWRLAGGSAEIANLSLDVITTRLPTLLSMPSTLRLARFAQLALAEAGA